METNNSNNGYSNNNSENNHNYQNNSYYLNNTQCNMQKDTLKSNSLVSSLIFSLCISLVLILGFIIAAYMKMPSYFRPDFTDLLFNEITIKSLIIVFTISEAILLLQSVLLLIASRIFSNCYCDFFSALNVSLKSFKVPAILLIASLIGALVHPLVTCVFIIISIMLLLINLYEGTRNLLSLPDNKVLLITSISIILNYGIIIWVSMTMVKSYIEDLFYDLLYFF